MKILVFKTNLCHKLDYTNVSFFLDNHPHIVNWSVDSEDIDKVLRIEADTDITTNIIAAITDAGFLCAELT